MIKVILFFLLTFALIAENQASDPPIVEDNGTIHVPAHKLPESSYLSAETRAILKAQRNIKHKQTCPPNVGADKAEMPKIRQCRAKAFYETPVYKNMRARHSVSIKSKVIDGVYIEEFIPDRGIATKNQHRVLINLHSGAYMHGSRTSSQMESIPIASVGKIKVISIDYRMGPEYIYPAASEDVATVYRALLKHYKPENIGIYGSSGGGMLVAQSMAWFQNEGLPQPAAIGLFFSGAPTVLDDENYKWTTSESGYMTEALLGADWESHFGAPHSYFKGIKRGSRLDSPGSYDEIMAKFPPTLLINGGARDFSLSMVVITHAQLVRLGVEADLHIWEGMPHCFKQNPDLQESQESYDVIVKFFDSHLGKKP